MSYREARQEGKEGGDGRTGDTEERGNEAAQTTCWRRIGRRGGLWLVHWFVTSAACWIEELCPADFNPNSLGNQEQVPEQALWGNRESDKRSKDFHQGR